MRFIPTLVVASLALIQNPANAQAAAQTRPKTATHVAAPVHAVQGCAKEAELSPKIPVLPAGTSCPKALYTLTTVPNIRVDYASPQETTLLESLGIESTSFSLNYIDTKVGTGPLAAPHKYYTIQYTGYLVDGTKFDSSYDHADHEPFVFAVGQHQVIAGWDTGFAGMHVGGKRRLFIPYQLAYGPTAQRGIPAKSELIFDLEFIAQSDEKPEPKPAPAPPVSTAPAQPATAPASATQPATPKPQ